ncbi:MAG: PDZ domain-containing protein [Novosphingobium sp.]|nr:PDZ domain-containing protein [Novosphingobium sp.]
MSLHDTLWWALAAAIALLSAILLWVVVTPVSPLGEWKPASVRVMSPAARSALFASLDPFNRGGAQTTVVTGPELVTSLALTLYGIRVNSATGGGSAIIAGSDGVQQVYRVGTEVTPGVILAGVHFDYVELSRNGSRELLYLDQSKPAADAATTLAASPAGPVGQTGPAAPASGALTADAVRQGISFQPRIENGRVAGLVVSAGGDGGAFRAAGFQPGDVITSIGGRAVANEAAGAELAAQLRPGQSVAVTVRRNGQQLPLAISLSR